MGFERFIFDEEYLKELEANNGNQGANSVASEVTPPAPFIPVRPPSGGRTGMTPTLLKLSLLLIPLIAYLGYHYYKPTEAGTTINTTITTNDDLENGLVGHWTFDGPKMNWASSTAEVLDSSASSTEGNMVNMGQNSAVAGKNGQALIFDGSDDYVTMGTGTAFTKTSPFSGAAWIKTNNTGAILSNWNNAQSPGWVFGVGLFSSTNLEFGTLNDSASAGRYRRGSTNINDGRWHFVSFTYDGSNSVTGIQLYVDGVLETMATLLNTDPGTLVDSDLEIGAAQFNVSLHTLYLQGIIDDVRIYNRVLSASEVKRLYELGATTHINTTIDTNDDLSNGLMVHYTFDGPDMTISSGTREILDTSGNGNHGNWMDHGTTTVAGKIGQALSFNKTSADREYVDGRSASGIDDIQNMTISAWVKARLPNTMSGEPAIVSKISSCNGTNQGWKLYLLDGTESGFFGFKRAFGSGSSQQGEWYASQSVLYGTWQHVVMTYSYASATNDPTFYINGSSSTTQESSTPVGSQRTDAAQVLTVGGCAVPGHSFEGDIDDVRVYNRILSTPEVKRLYEMGATTHINTTIDTNDNLENGLIGHWTFDGPKMNWSSTTAEVLDSSGNNSNGDLTNMDTSAATAGKIGQGLNFRNATNEYVALNQSVGATTTISLWIKPTPYTANDFHALVVQGGSTGLYFSDAGTPRINLYYSGSHYSTSAITYNTWQHVVIASNGGSGYYYLNGRQDGTFSNFPGFTGQAINFTNAAGYHFTGAIDDVRVYNRALSASEVKRLYELGGGH